MNPHESMHAYTRTTLQSLCSISGAIQPSVPVSPERAVKETFPLESFLQRPKSDIMARMEPLEVVDDSNTL